MMFFVTGLAMAAMQQGFSWPSELPSSAISAILS